MEQENVDSIWDQIMDHLGDEKALCDMGMGRIRGYVESIEQLLAERKNKLEHNMPILPVGMSEEEREEFLAEYASNIHEIDYELAKIQRYSLFVYSYSFFESTLKEIAESYGFMHNLKSYSSCYNNDKGIIRARKYFKNIGSIEWSESWSTWKDIYDIHLIRNLIVHNNGYFHKKTNKNPREDFLKLWNADLSAVSSEIELLCGFIFKTFFNELYAKFQTP